MSAAQAPSAQGSPFWRFSLHFYRQPKVAETCIALQEESGVDVNLLLFLLWQATRKRALTGVEVDHADLVPQCGQRNGGVHGRGRFAGPALFIGEDDMVRLGVRTH